VRLLNMHGPATMADKDLYVHLCIKNNPSTAGSWCQEEEKEEEEEEEEEEAGTAIVALTRCCLVLLAVTTHYSLAGWRLYFLHPPAPRPPTH
jgi:hypothetical protein